jgi:triosephosphate isomerase
MTKTHAGARLRRPLIVANWKMNGLRRDGLDRALALKAKLAAGPAPACDMVLCPPAPLLVELRAALDGSGVALGGQDCHAAEAGAYTGELAAAMLADVGCRYAIVGHSERRANHGETDTDVRAKAEAALKAGLKPIICVGESAAERERGEAALVVRRQVENAVPGSVLPGRFAIAYEPVWAIGSGRTPTVAEIAAMHREILQVYAQQFSDGAGTLRVLYGGSVNPGNAGAILALPEVGGALVGGASLSVEQFWSICLAADPARRSEAVS